jgi:hypothetical protein
MPVVQINATRYTVDQVVVGGGNVTARTTAAHGYRKGQKVTVTLSTQTQLNGTVSIAAVSDATHFYKMPGAPDLAATGVTRTADGILNVTMPHGQTYVTGPTPYTVNLTTDQYNQLNPRLVGPAPATITVIDASGSSFQYPPGGATGTKLTKLSAADGNVGWT